MNRDGSSTRPSSGFLSAVVADSRATMPRPPGATTHEHDDPHELMAHRSRGAPPPAASARQASETSSDVPAPAGPFAATDPAFAHHVFEPARQQIAATERAADNDRARADAFAPEAVQHGEVIEEGAPPSQPGETGRAGPDDVPPSHDRPGRPRGIQSGQGPASDRTLEHVDVSTRATGQVETPDSGAKTRDRTVRPAPARSGEDTGLPAPDTPAASREPARAGTWPPHAIQSANGSRPQTATPAVHIGTLDIRIEAPKQRATPPPRQPVRFHGSGILSRLYLPRE